MWLQGSMLFGVNYGNLTFSCCGHLPCSLSSVALRDSRIIGIKRRTAILLILPNVLPAADTIEDKEKQRAHTNGQQIE